MTWTCRRMAAEAVGVVLVVVALLACSSGGNSSACAAKVQLNGKAATGAGKDRLAARHKACRSWCEDHGGALDQDGVNACASRCAADLMFDRGTATVSCR